MRRYKETKARTKCERVSIYSSVTSRGTYQPNESSTPTMDYIITCNSRKRYLFDIRILFQSSIRRSATPKSHAACMIYQSSQLSMTFKNKILQLHQQPSRLSPSTIQRLRSVTAMAPLSSVHSTLEIQGSRPDFASTLACSLTSQIRFLLLQWG